MKTHYYFRVIGMSLAMAFGASTGMEAAVVAYWRFETDNGSAVTNNQTAYSVTDITGNGRNGTVGAGSPNYVSNTQFPDPVPQTGEANHFGLHMENDEVVTIASGGVGNLIGTNFTIEAFINPSNLSGAHARGIFRARNSGSFPVGLDLYDVDSSGSANDLRFFLPSATITYSANLSTGTTYHVAATYDGATIRLYLDGSLVGSTAYASWAGTNIQAGIGGDPEYPTGYNSSFRGNIDEVRISDAALAPSAFLNAIPEATPLSLLGVNLILLGLRRRRARE